MRYFTLFILMLSAGAVFSQPAAPATCTAAIGTPANGPQHYINVTWAAVGAATSYTLESSADNSTWTTVSSGTNVTTFSDDASAQGNVPVYFRVLAVNGSGSSAPTNCSTFPIYTACDAPALPVVNSTGTTTVSVQLVAESPTPNATGTTYAIYCATTGQYVQTNGTLGTNPAWQSMSAWATITVTALTSGTSYCFYAEAMNENGDIRTGVGSSLTSPQTFDNASSVTSNENLMFSKWYVQTDPNYSTCGTIPGTGLMLWKSTGGCSGGTGTGSVGTNCTDCYYFAFVCNDGVQGWLVSPWVNCTSVTGGLVTMYFDITNSADAENGTITFNAGSASNDYVPNNAVTVNGVATNTLSLSTARSCATQKITFNVSSLATLSQVDFQFSLYTSHSWEDANPFVLNIDNVYFTLPPATACATPTTCTAASISSNPTKNTVCAGSNTSFLIGTTGSVAGYQWQLSTDGGNTWSNITNNATYNNATTSQLTINATTIAMNGYEYRDSITGTCGGSTHSAAALLVVDALPSITGTVTGAATVCQGQNGVTYSISPDTAANSYTWSLPAGATIVSGNNTTSITVNYSSTATAGNIVVTPSSSFCGTGTPSPPLAITVNQLPAEPGTITGSNSLCANTAQTYSVASVTGATSYTWTLPSGWTSSSATNSIAATTGSTSGNVSVTANNGCGSSTAQTLAVTITSKPNTPGSISGLAAPCANSSQAYSVTPVSGATSYTWTLPTGWTGTSTSSIINATTGTGGGTISVTANNTCGNSAAQTLAVTPVTAPATPGTITGSATACNGSNQTYSITAVNGASSYNWTVPSGWSGSSSTSSINVTAGSNAGVISVTAINNCGTSAAQTLSVSVSQAPAEPGAITGNNNPCPNSAQTYSVASVNGATSYTWTLTSGWTGSSSTNSINATTGSNGGTISVTANNTCGNSAPQTLAVTLNSIPSGLGAISGLTAPCANSSQVYSVSSVNGATFYTWTLPSGWTGSSTTNSITATVGATGGNISVTADNACGNSIGQSLNVTPVTAPATPGAITGSATVCSSTDQTYSISNVNGATSYTWSLPSGWSGSSATSSINVTAGGSGGTISVTANNNCGNSTAQTLVVSVGQAPATPGTITGNANSCSNISQTYSVASVNGATSYTWTLPNGWTGSSATNNINATTGTNGGTISVTANNTCGNSVAKTLDVTIVSTPAEPGSIVGPSPACEGSTGTYSVSAVNGATFYTWTLPSGWSGSSTTDSMAAGVGTSGGTITVTAGNTCGSSTAQTMQVNVTSPLTNPGVISGPDSLCAGTSQAYSIAAVDGANSYTWTLPQGWTGSSSSNIINVTAGTGTGNISIVANSTCGSSAAQTLTVVGKPLPGVLSSISGKTELCAGDTATYHVSADANTNYYAWTLPNGWTGSSTTDSIVTISNASAGSISVTAYNGCGSSVVQTQAIVVNPLPQPGITSSAATICANDSSHICATGNFTAYKWNTGQTSSCIYVNEAGSYYVTVTDAHNCVAQTQPVSIAVYQVPSVSIIERGDTLSSYGEVSYQWYLNDTAILNATSPVYIAKVSGRYSVYVTDANGCSAFSSLIDLTVSGVSNLTETGLSVYPNPSTGSWQLQAGNEFIGSTVEIWDENGRLLYRSVLHQPHSQLDLNDAASGIYLLKVTPVNGNPVMQKLVKTGN